MAAAISYFPYFITPRLVASEFCRREQNFALEEGCQMVALHLAKTEVPAKVLPSNAGPTAPGPIGSMS